MQKPKSERWWGMMDQAKIIAFSNVSSEGLTIIFNKKISLNGGLSCEEWWISWDKLSDILSETKESR